MKLLDRSLRAYLLYSVVVILISTPIFHVVIERLFIEDVDEALLVRKRDLQSRVDQFPNLRALMNWYDVEDNTFFRPLSPTTPQRDSIYDAEYTEIVDPVTTEPEPFRELSTRLTYRGQPFHLITRISLVESEDLLQAIALTQAGLLILLLAGFVLLNRRISRQLWQPFYHTLEQLRQFGVDKNESLQLPPTDIAEFAELNQTLGELTSRGRQAFLRQKEFTDNAAHEMQTPVAIFQAKLELLSQTQPLTDNQAELIGSLNSVTVRLSRLNKSLLLLTRIDNQQYADTRPINLATLLDSLLNQSRESIEARRLMVERTGREDGPMVQANRTLLEILLTNLLVNAIRYTPSGGRIRIDAAPQSVTIANTGAPLTIPPEKLFARFQKGEAQTVGVGLGLAIAKQIAETNGYELTYAYGGGQHQFTLNIINSRLSP